MSKVRVQPTGEDGNIFNLVRIASKEMRRNGQEELEEDMGEKVFNSGSYNEALQMIMDYADVY